MTYQEKVEQIAKCHSGIMENVWHYFRTNLNPPYAVWQEDGQDAFYVNNNPGEISVTGTTDYFTKMEFDPQVDNIQNMFARNRFLWRLNNVQFEEETGLIHYEWQWEKL